LITVFYGLLMAYLVAYLIVLAGLALA